MNLFSDRMSKMEMKIMVHYLTMVTYSMTYSYAYNYRDDWRKSPLLTLIDEKYDDHKKYNGTLAIPEGWNLGGTPLNGAIVNAMNFIPKYRDRNGIQNLNVVFITDGASNDNSGTRVDYRETAKDKYDSFKEQCDGKSTKVYYDPITKKQYFKKEFRRSGQVTTATLLNMLKDRTKCNVVGFFLAQSGGRSGRVSNRDIQYMFPNQDIKELRKTLRKEKVLVCESMGYDEYYFVPGGEALAIDDGELEVNSEMTRGKMYKGFANYMKGKVVNRVLLNKFVEQIA